MCRLSWNLGASVSWKTQCLSEPQICLEIVLQTWYILDTLPYFSLNIHQVLQCWHHYTDPLNNALHLMDRTLKFAWFYLTLEEKQAFEMQSLSTIYEMADTRYMCCLNNMYVPQPFCVWCPYWFSSSNHRHLPKELYTHHKIRTSQLHFTVL